MSPISITIDNTLGAVFVGFIISTFLFGIVSAQVYHYYSRYSTDSGLFKTAVAFLWLAVLLQSVFAGHAVYHYCVSSFGNYFALTQVVWSFKAENIVTNTVIMLVHTLYLVRLWWFHRRLDNRLTRVWVPWIMGIALVSAYGGYFLSVVQVTRVTDFAWFQSVNYAIYVPFVIATVVDLAITTCVCLYLGPSSRSFESSSGMVARLVGYTLATGFLTSLCSFAGVIAYIVMPHNLVFLGIQLLLAKLYAVSLMTMLNMRRPSTSSAGNGSRGGLTVNMTTLSAIVHDGPDMPRSPKSPRSSKSFYGGSPLEHAIQTPSSPRSPRTPTGKFPLSPADLPLPPSPRSPRSPGASPSVHYAYSPPGTATSREKTYAPFAGYDV